MTDWRAAWSTELEAGLETMGIALTGQQRGWLVDYLALLQKWNRVFNLTAIRDPARMVSRQLLDSLSVLPHLAGPRVLDAGTGPGLPGIPLAVARPDLAFVLLDANGKKTRFVRQACTEIGLVNVEVVRSRLEAYRPDTGFDTVIARAFAPLARMVEPAGCLLAPGGRLLAMKGRLDREELQAIPRAAGRVTHLRLDYPGSDGERHLVIVEPAPRGTGPRGGYRL